MKKNGTVVVVGLGEIGKPVLELVSTRYNTVGVDMTPYELCANSVDVMHICYPFQTTDFVSESVRYIELFRPQIAIINSTVPVGTTRAVAQRSGSAVAHSPVRGKHIRMREDMTRYAKYVGALDRVTAQKAAQHFESIGLATRILSSPEATELAKLTETTYFGLLIAWAQDVERACDQLGPSYDEVTSFYDEINFFPPVKYFPGVIGGHCVLPNIELLRRSLDSDLVEAIRKSNKMKIERETRQDEFRRRQKAPTAELPHVTRMTG